MYAFYFVKIILHLGLHTFYKNFEKVTIASMWRQTTKGSKEFLGCLKGLFPRKPQVGCGQALPSKVWSWNISFK